MIQKHFKQITKKDSRKTGFTLIEIMVAITIFSLVMVVSIGAVLAMVSANKKSQALNSVITGLNFTLEGMVRDIRTGFGYSCNPGSNVPSDSPESGCTDIRFYSIQSGEFVTYSINNGSIYKRLDSSTAINITGNDVAISPKSALYIKDTATATSGNNQAQPRVVIVIRGSFNGGTNVSEFNLQTTVSQRRLDI